MRTLIIERRTLWTRWLETWAQLMPKAVARAIAGPSNRYVVGAAPPRTIDRLRPLEVVVPHDLVLRRRLRIPRMGLPDLPHAICLIVERETPFDGDELLIHAQQEETSDATQVRSFVVRMTPVIMLRRALEAARVPVRAVTGLHLEEADRALASVNLVAALRPSLRYRWLALALPIATSIAAALFLSQQYIAERSSQLATMEQYLASRVTQLESLSRKVEDWKARGMGWSTVTDLLVGTVSAHDSLRWLSAALPEATEVSRVQLVDGQMRITVRSPDVLADIETLNASSHGCSMSIVGALTTDPSAGLELATLVCTFEPK